jgi:hypothetical protein
MKKKVSKMIFTEEQRKLTTITVTNIISHEIRNLKRAYGWSIKRPVREKHKKILEQNILESIELSYAINILRDYELQVKKDGSSIDVLFSIDFDKLETIVEMRSVTDLNIQH